jgi:hypothetical protein
VANVGQHHTGSRCGADGGDGVAVGARIGQSVDASGLAVGVRRVEHRVDGSDEAAAFTFVFAAFAAVHRLAVLNM